MKKYLSWLLVVMLLFSFCFAGCDKQEAVKPGNPSEHTDANDDGVCDDCSQSVLVNFDFYVVNDLHGKFDDSDNQPGVDELSSYLRAAQFANDNTILLSSGDMWQGSSESNLTKGFIITEWMNHMDFAAMTLGNHEFDWGTDPIKENKEIAEFPFLAINIYDRSTNERVEYCDSSILIDQSGVQIGIIGAIGDCYSSIAPDWTKDIYFKTGSDLTQLVMDEATKLRQQGADFIVYSIHDGFGGKNYGDTISAHDLSAYYDADLSGDYVDVVFEAHTHKYYVKRDGSGVYHLQGGGDNVGIVHFDVDINSVTGSNQVVAAEFIGTEKYSTNFSDDPIVDELLEKYEDQVGVGKAILGYNAVSRNRDELRRIAADLYFEKGMELWGDEYDIVLGGGFFSVRSPGFLEQGDVTYSKLQMIFPFDNKLVLCSIQGRDLKEKFVETDNDNYFISYGDYGASVIQNIDPNATYYIIVDSYTSTYRYNNITEIQRYEENVYLRDLYAEFIQAGLLDTGHLD